MAAVLNQTPAHLRSWDRSFSSQTIQRVGGHIEICGGVFTRENALHFALAVTSWPLLKRMTISQPFLT